MSCRYEVTFSEKAVRTVFIRQRMMLSETPKEKQKWVFSSTAWVEAPSQERCSVCGISGGGVCPRVCLGHFLKSRPLLPGPRLPHLKHATVDGTNPQVSFIPVYK